MGQYLSNAQQKFCEDLHFLLQKNFYSVSMSEVEALVMTIEDLCPNIIGGSNFNLKTWDKIGFSFLNQPQVAISAQQLWYKVLVCFQGLIPKNITPITDQPLPAFPSPPNAEVKAQSQATSDEKGPDQIPSDTEGSNDRHGETLTQRPPPPGNEAPETPSSCASAAFPDDRGGAGRRWVQVPPDSNSDSKLTPLNSSRNLAATAMDADMGDSEVQANTPADSQDLRGSPIAADKSAPPEPIASNLLTKPKSEDYGPEESCPRGWEEDFASPRSIPYDWEMQFPPFPPEKAVTCQQEMRDLTVENAEAQPPFPCVSATFPDDGGGSDNSGSELTPVPSDSGGGSRPEPSQSLSGSAATILTVEMGDSKMKSFNQAALHDSRCPQVLGEKSATSEYYSPLASDLLKSSAHDYGPMVPDDCYLLLKMPLPTEAPAEAMLCLQEKKATVNAMAKGEGAHASINQQIDQMNAECTIIENIAVANLTSQIPANNKSDFSGQKARSRPYPKRHSSLEMRAREDYPRLRSLRQKNQKFVKKRFKEQLRLQHERRENAEDKTV